MEPRKAVRTQIIVLALLLVVASLLGDHSAVRVILAVALVSWVILEVGYRFSVRRHRNRILQPRRDLDSVMRQSLAVGISVGLVAEALSSTIGSELPFSGFVVRVIFGAGAIVAAVVVLSSMIDWFYVMPRVSGATGVAPCRVGANGMAFAALTKVWFFHRAVAAISISGIAGGVAAFLVPGIESRGLAASISVAGSLITIVAAEFNGDPIHVFVKSWLTPEVTVGSVVQMRAGYDTNTLRDAYIVDVSVNGYKFRFLDPDYRDPAAVRFMSKGEELSFDDADDLLASSREPQACESVERCQGVNWYCFRNPLANDPIPKTEDDDRNRPAPSSFEVRPEDQRPKDRPSQSGTQL